MVLEVLIQPIKEEIHSEAVTSLCSEITFLNNIILLFLVFGLDFATVLIKYDCPTTESISQTIDQSVITKTVKNINMPTNYRRAMVLLHLPCMKSERVFFFLFLVRGHRSPLCDAFLLKSGWTAVCDKVFHSSI